MLSGNGTIDYDVEVLTPEAQKTSAVCQESTTKNLRFYIQQTQRPVLASQDSSSLYILRFSSLS